MPERDLRVAARVHSVATSDPSRASLDTCASSALSSLVSSRSLSRNSDGSPTPRTFARRSTWLVAVLAVVGLAVCVILRPLNIIGQRSSELRSTTIRTTRLLTSDELIDTIVDHTIAFHREAEDNRVSDLSPVELRQLRESLRPQAQAQAFVLTKKVAALDAEAGRQLMQLELTTQQWARTHALLELLHDKRVRDLGQDVAKVMQQSGGDKLAVTRHLDARRDELRKLADEMIPAVVRNVPDLPNGQRHWEVAMSPSGDLVGEGKLGSWDASFKVDKGESDRRLADTTLPPMGPNQAGHYTYYRISAQDPNPWGGLGYVLWMTIGTAVAGIFSIISIILTITLGPTAAKILWLIHASLAGAVCGSTSGLTFIPMFKNVPSWIPCMVLGSASGLEAIWTFQKGGAAPLPVANPEGMCIRIVTGASPLDTGALSVKVVDKSNDVLDNLQFQSEFNPGEVVLEKCYVPDLVRVQVKAAFSSTHAWSGSIKSAVKSGTFQAMKCTNCQSASSDTAFIVVDGNDDTQQVSARTRCLNGATCEIVPN